MSIVERGTALVHSIIDGRAYWDGHQFVVDFPGTGTAPVAHLVYDDFRGCAYIVNITGDTDRVVGSVWL